MSSNPDALLGPAEVRELAAALGVRPTKQRGQNFVIDANTVRRIVRTADVRPDDVVVEVGPGLGSLTLALLEVADRVTAVEIDDTLASALPATVTARMPDRADRFALVHSDAMQVTELPGPPPTALVANLPYNVAVPVLLHMLEHFPSIERTLVMVQAEVADRLAAPPGSKVYGVPSVKANWYAEVKRAGSIGRTVFWPAPNVDSGLVALTRRTEPPKTTATRREVFAVVDAAFAQRRKTLRAALAGWAGSAAAAEIAIVAAGVSPQARGESLTVEEFARIAENKPTGTEVTTHAGTEREAGTAENAGGVGAGDALRASGPAEAVSAGRAGNAPSASRAAETANTVRPGDAQREARAAEVVGDAQAGSALREAGPAESASPGRAGNAPSASRAAETANTVRSGDAQREARAAEVVGDAQAGSALREAGPAESASPGRAGNAPHEGRPAEAVSDAQAGNALRGAHPAMPTSDAHADDTQPEEPRK